MNKNTKQIETPKVKTARFSMRLDEDLIKKLERKALSHNVSASVIARHALESFLAEE